MVSFDEMSDWSHMKDKTGLELLRSFGVHLLYYNRVPLESAQKVASLDDAITLLQERLNLIKDAAGTPPSCPH